MREHIEAAMKGQAGADTSTASLATDFALIRDENKALGEERDRLKKAVQRSSGAQLDQVGTQGADRPDRRAAGGRGTAHPGARRDTRRAR
ncbi:hypothetical protein ACOZDE_27080 [Streptomyces griseoincarnatus]